MPPRGGVLSAALFFWRGGGGLNAAATLPAMIRATTSVALAVLALAGCGQSTEQAVTDRLSELAEREGVTDQAVRSIPRGTPRAEVIARLGKPMQEERREADAFYPFRWSLMYRAKDGPAGAFNYWTLGLDRRGRLRSREKSSA